MKEFTTAVKEKQRETEDEGWVEFKVDTEVLRARYPGDGQIAYLLAGINKRASKEQQIATAINFIVAIMDQDSEAYLCDRLLDQDDDFGLHELSEIVEFLMEEWSGRPTERVSGSAK